MQRVVGPAYVAADGRSPPASDNGRRESGSPERRDRTGPHPAPRPGGGARRHGRVPPLGAVRPRRGPGRRGHGPPRDRGASRTTTASTGWCVMIAMTTGLLGAFLPEEHARAIYGVRRRRHRRLRGTRRTGHAPRGRRTGRVGALGVGLGHPSLHHPRGRVPPHRAGRSPERSGRRARRAVRVLRSRAGRAARHLARRRAAGHRRYRLRGPRGAWCPRAGGSRSAPRPRGWTGRSTASPSSACWPSASRRWRSVWLAAALDELVALAAAKVPQGVEPGVGRAHHGPG